MRHAFVTVAKLLTVSAALLILAAASPATSVAPAARRPDTSPLFAEQAALPQASAGDVNAPELLAQKDLQKLIPATVFFQGQTATVQLRNSGGVRFPDGLLMFAVKVDTGGYASATAERYQDYLVTEDTLQFGAHTLPAGAYGMGFVPQGLIIMDLGGHTLVTVPSETDSELKRPVPLRVALGAKGSIRIYSGRNFAECTVRAHGSGA